MATSLSERERFLICCVIHKKDNRVDFGEVARIMKIASDKAASKRYSRLFIQYRQEMALQASDTNDAAGTVDAKDKPTGKKASSKLKKRKVDDEEAEEEEEMNAEVAEEKSVVAKKRKIGTNQGSDT